jgi:hypothetical protein
VEQCSALESDRVDDLFSDVGNSDVGNSDVGNSDVGNSDVGNSDFDPDDDGEKQLAGE